MLHGCITKVLILKLITEIKCDLLCIMIQNLYLMRLPLTLRLLSKKLKPDIRQELNKNSPELVDNR